MNVVVMCTLTTGLSSLRFALDMGVKITKVIGLDNVHNRNENAISGVDKRARALDAETRAAMRQAEKTMRGIAASANERFDAKINRVTATARQSEKNIRDITESASGRFDAKINGIDAKLNVFEKRQDKKLRDALNNPLLK